MFIKDQEKEALLEKKRKTQLARDLVKKEAELALQIVSPAAENEESKGKLDDLLASLKTGQAPVRRPVQKEIPQISRKSSVLNQAMEMLENLEF